MNSTNPGIMVSGIEDIWIELVIAVGIQWVAWIFAVIFRTEKFYDLTGSATFTSILVYILVRQSSVLRTSQIIQEVLVLIWTLRLGGFLFWRVMKSGEDRRFREIKTNPFRFFVTWTLQGIWVYVTLFPSLLMWHKTLTSDTSTSPLAIVGWIVWGIGFLTETVSDIQKSIFRSKPENNEKFIRSGLWSISRHPNYLGEILLWFGLYISAASTYSNLDFLTVLCPIFDAVLIIFISGIPMLEKSSDRKWGTDQEYQEYKAKTKKLIPFIW